MEGLRSAPLSGDALRVGLLCRLCALLISPDGTGAAGRGGQTTGSGYSIVITSLALYKTVCLHFLYSTSPLTAHSPAYLRTLVQQLIIYERFHVLTDAGFHCCNWKPQQWSQHNKNNKSFTTVYYNLWFLTNTLLLFNLQDFKIPSNFSLEINKHQTVHSCGKNVFIHCTAHQTKRWIKTWTYDLCYTFIYIILHDYFSNKQDFDMWKIKHCWPCLLRYGITQQVGGGYWIVHFHQIVKQLRTYERGRHAGKPLTWSNRISMVLVGRFCLPKQKPMFSLQHQIIFRRNIVRIIKFMLLSFWNELLDYLTHPSHCLY